MKIINNFSIPKTLNCINFKGKIINFSQHKSSKQTEEKSASNPLCHQILKKITMHDLKLEVDLNGFGKYPLNIKSHDIIKYLSDETDKIQPELLEKFVSLYQSNLETLMIDAEKEIEAIKQSLDAPKILDFNKIGNMPSTKERKSIKNLLKIMNESKNDVLPDIAYKRTLRLFQISKTKTGYDFSSIEEKNKLIGKIEYYSESDDYFDLVLLEIKKHGTNDDGSFNFELIDAIISILNNNNTSISIGKMAAIIKRFSHQNPENTAQIIKTIEKLSNGYIGNSSNFSIEDLLEKCFDDKKFNPKKAEVIVNSVKSTDKWITESLRSIEVGKKIEYLNALLKTASNLLNEYFQTITDENGNLKPDIKSMDEFIESKS